MRPQRRNEHPPSSTPHLTNDHAPWPTGFLLYPIHHTSNQSVLNQLPHGHVFTAPNGGPLRVTAFRARAWRAATKAAGLDGLRIHDLRHTAVALWIAAGASPKEVAALAGHTSVSFTLDRYGHLYPDSYATLRDRLDAMHSSTQERDAEVIDLSSTLVRPQRDRNVQ